MFYKQIFKTSNHNEDYGINLLKKLCLVGLEITINLIVFLIILIVSIINHTGFFSFISGNELFWSAFTIFAICIGEYILYGQSNKSKTARISLIACWILSFLTLSIYILISFEVVIGNTSEIFYASLGAFLLAGLCNFLSVV